MHSFPGKVAAFLLLICMLVLASYAVQGLKEKNYKKTALCGGIFAALIIIPFGIIIVVGGAPLLISFLSSAIGFLFAIGMLSILWVVNKSIREKKYLKAVIFLGVFAVIILGIILLIMAAGGAFGY